MQVNIKSKTEIVKFQDVQAAKEHVATWLVQHGVALNEAVATVRRMWPLVIVPDRGLCAHWAGVGAGEMTNTVFFVVREVV